MNDDFFDDLTPDEDLLIHTVDVFRPDQRTPDDAAGRVTGTTLDAMLLVKDSVPCLIEELTAEAVAYWQTRNVKASHSIYFGSSPPAFRAGDVCRWNGSRYFLLQWVADPLLQNVYQRGVAVEKIRP